MRWHEQYLAGNPEHAMAYTKVLAILAHAAV